MQGAVPTAREVVSRLKEDALQDADVAEMTTDPIAIRFLPGTTNVRLRELRGADEQLIGDTSSATTIRLLDRLVDVTAAEPWRAALLTASDRDRLLAVVFRNTYGQHVENTLQCTQCGDRFDIGFALDELMVALDRSSPLRGGDHLPDGTYCIDDGTRFRLPTGEDEVVAGRLPLEDAEQALLERCLLEEPANEHTRAAVEKAIQEIAPIVDLDLDAVCPQCDARQTVHFDLQFYLLRSLEQEQARLTREVHRIATAYGWTLTEILGLCRSERRRFVELIEAELPQSRRRQ